MEEGEKDEQVEIAKILANSPDEEQEQAESEQAESKISDETHLKAEAAPKKNEMTQKKQDERRPGDTKEEVLKGEMAKEPSKKAPVSSFFGEAPFAGLCTVPLAVEAAVHVHMCCFVISTAPRKAAVKMQKPETHEGEKKTSAALKTSADEDAKR